MTDECLPPQQRARRCHVMAWARSRTNVISGRHKFSGNGSTMSVALILRRRLVRPRYKGVRPDPHRTKRCCKVKPSATTCASTCGRSGRGGHAQAEDIADIDKKIAQWQTKFTPRAERLTKLAAQRKRMVKAAALGGSRATRPVTMIAIAGPEPRAPRRTKADLKVTPRDPSPGSPVTSCVSTC